MQNRIEVFRPSLDVEEYAAIAAVLASGWLGGGARVREFERAWAGHVGVPAEHLTALTSATEALYQVCAWIAAHRRGTEIILPANAFIGAANAVRAAGLMPVLCDVDESTLNPTVQHIWTVATRDTAAVIVQHFGGVPSHQEFIGALCEENGWTLVEDCACAPASMFNGLPAGIQGDFGLWSFDAMKIITTGDGGMLYCRDEQAAMDIRRGTHLGQSVESGQASQAERWWEFTVDTPGRRAGMNDIAAAMGLAQLAKLPALVARRRAVWEQYQTQLAQITWLTLPPEPPPGVRSSYYCYWVQSDERDALAHHLRARGIYTTYRYWPVHRAYGWPANVPNAEWASAHTLLLPLHAELSAADVDTICVTLREWR